MNADTYICGSCACSGISGLGEHENAVDAMQAFCRSQLGPSGTTLLVPYYIFVAGPEVAAGKPGSSHHSKAWVRYGTEFAAFIIENELGDIATVGPKLNKKYHSTTTCQIWAWSPDQAAVVEWWKNNKGKTTKKGFV